MSDELAARLAEIGPIVEKVRPILAGVHPSIQGAVLADLVGIWLAGHVFPGDREQTSRLLEELLSMHVGTVRVLVVAQPSVSGWIVDVTG